MQEGFIRQLGVISDDVVDIVLCDNQFVIHLSKYHTFHLWSKHIDIKLHFIRDIDAQGLVKLNKVYIEKNPSNMLTKSMTIIKFKHCLDLTKVSHVWSLGLKGK